ncbi:MAG: phosphodiester glycosidase family protein [Armatimonadota bacterium]
MNTRATRRCVPRSLLRCLLLLCALLFLPRFAVPAAADSVTVTKVGQGVWYKKFHYNSLFGAPQDVYILDANLNDPEVVVRFPYLTGGSRRTTSGFATGTGRAVGAVNGQFFDGTGSVQYLKVNGSVINGTKPDVHDQQAITQSNAGPNGTAGVNLIPKPANGWGSLGTPNIMASGPDLIQNGVRISFPNHSFYQGRNARTAAAWTYDNRFLLMVVDYSSTSAGMSLPEVSQTLVNYANVRHALNLDGGGSSTLWAGGALKNRPKDGSERLVANAVVVTSAAAIPNRVGMARTPSGNGYWIVSSEGYVFCFGDAPYYGSMGGQPLNQPIVGIAARPQGDGYWLVASDGGIFCFGNAPFRGSMGGTPLNQPMVGMASTADGNGYWTVAKDGGVFSFNAPFHGSTGSFGITNVKGMVATPGNGYWLYASDGGIFSFNAPFHGSMGGQGLNDFAGMASLADASGYWLVRANGSIYSFGAAGYGGGADEPGQFAGIARGRSGTNSYFLLKKDGAIYTYGDSPYAGGANY